MEKRNSTNKIVDHIFWIAFILFTNPGSILKVLGLKSDSGGIGIIDILFFILFFCTIIVLNKSNFYRDKTYSKILRLLIIFLIYYVLIFSYFVPLFKNNSSYSVLTTFIKIRHGVYNILLIIMLYEFSLRSVFIFFKYLLISSITVLFLFLVTVSTGIDIIPIAVWERGFIQVKRLVMEEYGLMPLLIPFGIVCMVFKFEIKYKKFLYLGAVLMYLTWMLSLFRRHIFGSIIIYFLVIMLANYINRKKLFSPKKVFQTLVYGLILLFVVQLSFPDYVDAGIESGKETINIIQYGQTSTGQKDVRLGLGKEFMQDLIKKNWVFGTGFDNRWRTGEGDSGGFEASDYPFLGALAMTGVVGLIFFIPVYILLFKTLILDVKFLRNVKLNNISFDAFFFLSFVVFFIYDLLQYMNWFLPLSLFSIERGKYWYIPLAFYLSSRRLFYDINKSVNIDPVSSQLT